MVSVPLPYLEEEVDIWLDNELMMSITLLLDDETLFDCKDKDTVSMGTGGQLGCPRSKASLGQDLWDVPAYFDLVDSNNVQLGDLFLDKPTKVDVGIDWFGEPARLVMGQRHAAALLARRHRRERSKKGRESKAKAIVKRMTLLQQRYSVPTNLNLNKT